MARSPSPEVALGTADVGLQFAEVASWIAPVTAPATRVVLKAQDVAASSGFLASP